MKEEEGGTNWESSFVTNAVLRDNVEGWNGVGDGKEVREGGEKCIPMADSCWCMAETHTILLSNFPPIKNKYIFKKLVQSLGEFQYIKPWCLVEHALCIRPGAKYFWKIFIYVAALGLNSCMWDLVPWPGIEPRSPAMEHRVLDTGTKYFWYEVDILYFVPTGKPLRAKRSLWIITTELPWE